MTPPARVVLDGRSLTLDALVRLARREALVALDPAALAACARAHEVLGRAAAEGQAIYGLNRGVGFYKDRRVSPQHVREFHRGLLRAHAGGVGEEATAEQVRAVMVARLNTLLRGHAGCSPALLEAYAALLEHDLLPCLPLRGSVGEGDITCLAHVGLAMTGEGWVRVGGRRRRAGEALAEAGLEPLELGSKDSLAIVSSNALAAGLGALVLEQAQNLLETADVVLALSLEGLHGHLSPLDEAVVRARRFRGLAASARNLRGLLRGSYLRAGGPPGKLQDPLSFRTGAHVHGAARDALAYARHQLGLHLNASEDNPCVLPEQGAVLPSGNFDPLAWVLAFEQLGLAMAHVSKLACRRAMRLADPGFTGLPAYLAGDRELGFGYSEIQKTFASLQAEVRHLANPGTLDDLSLAGDLEDHAANGPLVVRKTGEMLGAIAYVLGIEALHGKRAIDLRGEVRLGRGTRVAYEVLSRNTSFRMGTDRNLTPDIEKAAKLVREGLLIPDQARERAARRRRARRKRREAVRELVAAEPELGTGAGVEEALWMGPEEEEWRGAAMVFDQELWLQVTPLGASALSPRLALKATPYAFALVGGVPASDPNPLPAVASSPATVTHTADGAGKTVTTAERVIRIRTDGGTSSSWYLCELNVASGEVDGMEVAVVLAEAEASGERPLLRRYNDSDCSGVSGSNIVYNGNTQFFNAGDAVFCKYFDGLLLDGSGGWLCTSD